MFIFITSYYSLVLLHWYFVITTYYYMPLLHCLFHYFPLRGTTMGSKETITTYYASPQLGDVGYQIVLGAAPPHRACKTRSTRRPSRPSRPLSPSPQRARFRFRCPSSPYMIWWWCCSPRWYTHDKVANVLHCKKHCSDHQVDINDWSLIPRCE